MNYLKYLILCLIFSGCNSPKQKLQAVKFDQIENNQDSILITAVGDIMIGSTYPSPLHLPPNDGINSFKAVQNYLKGDIVFGNLEGTFLNDDTPPKCNDSISKNCYAFRMPEHYGKIIKNAGFNVLSIANNHINDFKSLGRKRTTKVLDSLNIHYAGLINKPYKSFTIKNKKFAFLAFAPNANTLSIHNLNEAKRLVDSLKKENHIVLVSFHGGGEGTDFEHVTRAPEIYINENRGNVYAFSHAVIDAGADLVLGHGPHVTRAVEVYKNKFIAYSLGNFCTYGKFNISGPSGIAPILNIYINEKGDFMSAKVISTAQSKSEGLTIDSLNSAFYKIKNLTDADFKGHQLDFSKVGYIKLK